MKIFILFAILSLSTLASAKNEFSGQIGLLTGTVSGVRTLDGLKSYGIGGTAFDLGWRSFLSNRSYGLLKVGGLYDLIQKNIMRTSFAGGVGYQLYGARHNTQKIEKNRIDYKNDWLVTIEGLASLNTYSALLENDDVNISGSVLNLGLEIAAYYNAFDQYAFGISYRLQPFSISASSEKLESIDQAIFLSINYF